MEAAIARMLQKEAEQLTDDEFGDGGSGEEEEEGQSSEEAEEGSGDEEAGGASEGGGSDDNEGTDADEEREEEDEEDDGAVADTDGEGGSSSGGDDSGEEGGEGGRARREREPGFLEGGKAGAFAKAFTKILEKAEAKGAAAKEAPILVGSKSVAKRKAEEAEAAQHDKEAKRLRQEMKQRGHVVPTKRGQDPAADVREKALQRLATRGVVRLFNAIAKAQKQLRDAEEQTGNKAKAAKLGRASFLAELKGSAGAAGTAGSGDQVLVPSAPGQAAAATGRQQQQQKQQQPPRQRQGAQQAGGGSSSDEEGDAAGWDVLQKGFVGLQGGNKMKDWDKQVSEGEESPGESLGNDSDEDGW